MERIAIGKIRTAHGVKGFLKVMSFSGETDHFLGLKDISLVKDGSEKQFPVEEVRSFSGTVLIKLKGIDSPEAGKRYSGWEVWVPRDKGAPLQEGEYYLKDLNGCIITHEGNELGKVIGIGETSINDILEIRTENGIYMVPFKDEYIGDVDTVSGKIELIADWLLK